MVPTYQDTTVPKVRSNDTGYRTTKTVAAAAATPLATISRTKNLVLASHCSNSRALPAQMPSRKSP